MFTLGPGLRAGCRPGQSISRDSVPGPPRPARRQGPRKAWLRVLLGNTNSQMGRSDSRLCRYITLHGRPLSRGAGVWEKAEGLGWPQPPCPRSPGEHSGSQAPWGGAWGASPSSAPQGPLHLLGSRHWPGAAAQHMDVAGEDHPLSKLRVRIEPGPGPSRPAVGQSPGAPPRTRSTRREKEPPGPPRLLRPV